MGIEYTLRFTYPEAAAVASVLRCLPLTRELPSPWVGFELRSPVSVGDMPDASVQVEPYGVYFCDNGGHGRELLGAVLARLVAEFGAVTVSELE
jgi:hypothetical protein